MKAALGRSETITFTDILGMEQTCGAEEVQAAADEAGQSLVNEVAAQVLELNGGAPSALFLAGGGSKLSSLREKMAHALGMDPRRVALAGAHFKTSAFSDAVELDDPEYTTPLGIAVSAGLGLISDSYRILLNGRQAKLFRNGRLTLLELLMMNGYGYRDLLGRNGKSAVLEVNGRRLVFPGEPSQPAVLEVNGAPARPSDVIHAGEKVRFVPATAGADRKVTAREVLERLGAQSLLADGAPLDPEDQVPAGVRLETASAPASVSEPEAPTVSEPERPAAEGCRLTLNGRTLLLPPKPEGGPYYLMDLLERSGIDFEHLDRPVRLAVNGQAGAFQQVLRSGDQVEIRYEA